MTHGKLKNTFSESHVPSAERFYPPGILPGFCVPDNGDVPERFLCRGCKVPMKPDIPGAAWIRPSGRVDCAVFDNICSDLSEHFFYFGDVVVFNLAVGPWEAEKFVDKPVPWISRLKVVAGD